MNPADYILNEDEAVASERTYEVLKDLPLYSRRRVCRWVNYAITKEQRSEFQNRLETK